MKVRIAVSGALLALLAACGSADARFTAAPLEESMASRPWPAFYQRAGELFAAGQRDEAVKLFYIGQLRGRIAARCTAVRPDQDPALLASLNATLGQSINEYAGGSPSQWAEAIEDALAWETEHFDASSTSARCRDERAAQREGLKQLRQHILANADDIRRQRTANGLPNRQQ